MENIKESVFKEKRSNVNKEELILSAVREQMNRVPYLTYEKSHKVFVLNVILISGLSPQELFSYLDSLNAYDMKDKKWEKVKIGMTLEKKFDALGWKPLVNKLIEVATHEDNNLIAA